MAAWGGRQAALGTFFQGSCKPHRTQRSTRVGTPANGSQVRFRLFFDKKFPPADIRPMKPPLRVRGQNELPPVATLRHVMGNVRNHHSSHTRNRPPPFPSADRSRNPKHRPAARFLHGCATPNYAAGQAKWRKSLNVPEKNRKYHTCPCFRGLRTASALTVFSKRCGTCSALGERVR